MKFKFCSEGDCPLWALAALHALGSLPAPLFKELVQRVVEENSEDSIMDILKDTSLSSREEAARAAAVIRWALRQAWSSAAEVSGAQLARDLLVLGAPRPHAHALATQLDRRRDAYRADAHAHANRFMVNRVTDVSVAPGPERTVDTFQLTFHADDVSTGEPKRRELLVDRSHAESLLEELKKAYKKMEQLDAVES